MVHFTVGVVLMAVVGMYSTAESCTNFTTHTTLTGESATLTFSLPDACKNDLSLVTVSVGKSTGEATEICLLLSTSWSKKSTVQCTLDQQSQEYSVTRQLGTTASGRESVILTAEFGRGERIVTRVLLELPDISTVPSVTTSYTTIADGPQTTVEPRQASGNRGGTAKLTTDSSTNGAGPSETGTRDADESSEKEESPGPKDDNSSFTQTPAFAGFLIVGVVMAIIIILLVVLLVRQKGIPALFRRRARNSLVIPDNYERPTGTHNYERPIHRRGIQQQPLPPLPPPNPADVNRDSLTDPNYAVIDDVSGGYEIPKMVAPSVPTAGGSTQAESSL